MTNTQKINWLTLHWTIIVHTNTRVCIIMWKLLPAGDLKSTSNCLVEGSGSVTHAVLWWPQRRCFKDNELKDAASQRGFQHTVEGCQTLPESWNTTKPIKLYILTNFIIRPLVHSEWKGCCPWITARHLSSLKRCQPGSGLRNRTHYEVRWPISNWIRWLRTASQNQNGY